MKKAKGPPTAEPLWIGRLLDIADGEAKRARNSKRMR